MINLASWRLSRRIGLDNLYTLRSSATVDSRVPLHPIATAVTFSSSFRHSASDAPASLSWLNFNYR